MPDHRRLWRHRPRARRPPARRRLARRSRYFRIFSPAAQARRFDPDGGYIKRWVPELGGLPAAALAEPWTHGALLARLAPGYPRRPIVDLKASRAEALAACSFARSLPPH